LREVALDDLARRRHPHERLGVELDRGVVARDQRDVRGREAGSAQAQPLCSTPPVQARELTFLSGADVERLALTDDEILAAVEDGLRAQGSGQARIEPRVHLKPDPELRGHFNVLRGYLAPLQLAGVKVVGDYLDNHELGLPS